MSRRPLWRLEPWTRAPLLGLRSTAAVVAVLVTTAILACAVASAPLFLSSARSAALQQQLAGRCAEVGMPQTGVVSLLVDPQTGQPLHGDGRSAPPVDTALTRAWQAAGYQPQPVLATGYIGSTMPQSDPMLFTGPDGAQLPEKLTVFFRPSIAQHVTVVDRAPGDGVLVPASVAEHDRLSPGDTVSFSGQQVQVAGIYRDLAVANADDPYWCDYRQLFLNEASANSAPPAVLLATDPTTFFRLATAHGYATRLQQVHVDPAALTTTEARRLLRLQQRIADSAGLQPRPRAAFDPGASYGVPNDRLVALVSRAGIIESGLRGPVVPVAVAGGLLALVLVAAAGSFWADRRATEVRLLAARGVGPVPLAGKAALELGLPALVGAALGWGLSRLLIGTLGPSGDLDPAATTAAVWTAVAAFVVGLASAATVAGLRARGTAERPLGAAARWPAKVPWELALLIAAGWCWVLLQGRDAVVSVANVAQVNGLLVAFPLLAIAGAAALLSRGLTALLPRLRGWATRRSSAVFLAVNRLAANRGATAALLVAVVLPVAVLGYTSTLTASSRTTLAAKVGVQLGGAETVSSVTRLDPTPAIRAAGTFVVRYDGSIGGSEDVQVLAVDPQDFARTAFWDDSFADESLDRLVAALQEPERDGRLPVVAAGLPAGATDLRVGRMRVPADVVATARVLPGDRTNSPVVLVAADRLGEIPRNAQASPASELWADRVSSAASTAMTAAGAQNIRVFDADVVQETANFLGITWTFGYLSALAVFVGVIAVGGLLLYLEARSRSRVSGYVMARRLGLSRAGHLRSLLLELVGVSVVGLVLGGVLAAGAVALVYRRLDVDLLRPPTELLDVPWATGAVTALATLVIAALAALYAQRAADRADPATVLRENA